MALRLASSACCRRWWPRRAPGCDRRARSRRNLTPKPRSGAGWRQTLARQARVRPVRGVPCRAARCGRRPGLAASAHRRELCGALRHCRLSSCRPRRSGRAIVPTLRLVEQHVIPVVGRSKSSLPTGTTSSTTASTALERSRHLAFAAVDLVAPGRPDKPQCSPTCARCTNELERERHGPWCLF